MKLSKKILIPILTTASVCGAIIPAAVSCAEETKPEDSINKNLFGVYAYERSTFTLTTSTTDVKPNLQYSFDGKKWETYGYDYQVTIEKGSYFYLKGQNPNGWKYEDDGKGTRCQPNPISFTGSVAIGGNVMALINNGNESSREKQTIPCASCFDNLFGNLDTTTTFNNDAIKWVSPDFLPAVNLQNNCYRGMFAGCRQLTNAPKLPATILKNQCYEGMFEGCEQLEKAPDLMAKTLVKSCYENMFNGCKKLNYIKIGFTKDFAEHASPSEYERFAKDWVKDVNASGTFYYKPEAPEYKQKAKTIEAIPAQWRINDNW